MNALEILDLIEGRYSDSWVIFLQIQRSYGHVKDQQIEATIPVASFERMKLELKKDDDGWYHPEFRRTLYIRRRKSEVARQNAQNRKPRARVQNKHQSDISDDIVPEVLSATPAEERFNLFWQHVHHKTAKGRARRALEPAIKRKAKADGISKKDAFAIILTRMKQFKASPLGRDTPLHPSTWLNDDRFEDDPSTWRNSFGSASKTGAERRQDRNAEAAADFLDDEFKLAPNA